MTEKNQQPIPFKAGSEGPHFILNPLAGKKTIAKSKNDRQLKKQFHYIDKEFSDTNIQAGVFTRKRTIKTVDLSLVAGFSLSDLFKDLPGLTSKKWLSQSQIMKIYKHFRNHLAPDDIPNLFLCKKSESREIDDEDDEMEMWKNLQVVEIIIDHEDDAYIRITPHNLLYSKSIIGGNFRIFIPVRC